MSTDTIINTGMGKNDFAALVQKYNVAAPRYTSYPTVPHWEMEAWDLSQWLKALKTTFVQISNEPTQGVSIYVHLPFCESLCTYCGCNTRITKNHSVEEPYIAAILKEWQLYRIHLGGGDIPISEIHLGGGTPTFFSPELLERLMVGLLANSRIVPGASFSFEAHPANTSTAHLQTLYDMGFRRLSLGIQDFDADVQQMINRMQTEADVSRVMESARSIGYTSINFDLIYGLPLQTPRSVSMTIEKALAMQPDRISFYSYAHVPWMKPGQRRFTTADLPVGKDKLFLYNIGKEKIMEAGYRDIGMDHFALPGDELFKALANGKLHRNFMGYTERYSPLLIGLGVSSISDSWTAFAQNVKTVEKYHAAITMGKLPLAKGHILSGDDRLLRRHILDIMCKGKTVLPNGSYLMKRILERLVSLIEDGLVEWDGRAISVTPIGFSFLRNICMAFDERLHQKKRGEQSFSQAV